MLVLPGPRAFSEFRLARLLERVRGAVPAAGSLDARFAHFALIDGEFAPREAAILERLLEYGPQDGSKAPDEAPDEELVLVVPRLGTISPWASKATRPG